MRADIPTGLQSSAFELEGDAIVSLYVLTLASGPIFRLSPYQTVTWQGAVYEQASCTMTEMQLEADGKANRPTFSFGNPEGVFTQFMYGGLLENASLQRYRMLRDDLVNNRNFAIQESMRVAQILTVIKGIIVLQLRDVHDGQSFMLPARAYFPPEFPHVKL